MPLYWLPYNKPALSTGSLKVNWPACSAVMRKDCSTIVTSTPLSTLGYCFGSLADSKRMPSTFGGVMLGSRRRRMSSLMINCAWNSVLSPG
ncbi:Uncharacterised protein [Vibrio cholerae]|nr:Uncharacterised protein [Vibrio cholerae]